MIEEEGRSGDVSDIENTTSLICFDIRGFERCRSKCHFNSDNIEEGWNKCPLTSQMEGHEVCLEILLEITST